MSKLGPNDIIGVGFRRGVDVELLCTENGLRFLPEIEKQSPRSGDYYTVIVSLKPENFVPLRLCGVKVSALL
jgi:hypothetical protein